MDKLKEMLASLKEKAVENKEVLIRVGLAVAGAALGAAITTVVVANQDPELSEYDTLLTLTEDEAEANGDIRVE